MQASRNAFFKEHLWTTTFEVEVFYKKRCKKSSLHFIWKHLMWSLFLIKLQAWDLFGRTSANYCFCTALASLAVPYQFYFIFSTFFFIITATTVNIFLFGSNSKGFKELKSGISFSLKSLYWCYFIFSFFLSLSVVSFFPVAANKKDFFKLKID